MWIMGSGLMDCELLYPHAEYQEQAPGSPFLACQLHFLKQWPPPHLQWKINFLTGDNSGKKKKKTCWDKLLKKNIPHYNAYHNSPWPWAVQYFPPLPLHETVYHQIQSEMFIKKKTVRNAPHMHQGWKFPRVYDYTPREGE